MNNLIQTIQVLTPEEVEFVNAELDKKGKFIDDFVSCRHLNEFTMSTPEKIDYIEKIEHTGKPTEQYGLKNKIIVTINNSDNIDVDKMLISYRKELEQKTIDSN